MDWDVKIICLVIAIFLNTGCNTNSTKENSITKKEKDLYNIAVIHAGKGNEAVIDTLFVEMGDEISHIDILNLFVDITKEAPFSIDSLQDTTEVSDSIRIIYYQQSGEKTYSAYYYKSIGAFYVIRTDFVIEYFLREYSAINSDLLDSLIVFAQVDHENRVAEMFKPIDVDRSDSVPNGVVSQE